MRKTYYIIFALFFFISSMHMGGEESVKRNSKVHLKDENTIGRIGFIHDFVSDKFENGEEVLVGLESSCNSFFKLCSSDGETVAKGGLLNKGMNIIGFPVNLIIGENKGVFLLFIKNGKYIIGKQIFLRSDVIKTNPEIDASGVVRDKYRHTITVTGDDRRDEDYAARITQDSVNGDYPRLSQGIPVLSIFAFLVSSVLKVIKKKKKKTIPLYSETEFYFKQKKGKGENILLNLRIFTSEI